MNQVRYWYWLGATAVACAVSGVAAPAMAQSSGAAAPTSASPFDAVTAFGQTLAKDGIFLNLSYIEDLSSVVAGGQKTGTMPIGHATAGVVFDLQTLMGITGASFHVTFGRTQWRVHQRHCRLAIRPAAIRLRPVQDPPVGILLGAGVRSRPAGHHVRPHQPDIRFCVLRHLLLVRRPDVRTADHLVLQQFRHRLSVIDVGWPRQLPCHTRRLCQGRRLPA